MQNMTYIWLAAMIILLIFEAIVPGLISIWFALGALAALIAALAHAPIWLQIVIYLITSLASLILTKPLVQKYVNSKVQHTNADAVIGKECIVTEKVDNVMGTGSAKVDGKEWSARSSADNVTISKGSRARIISIEGVKLIIEPNEI